MYTTYDGSHSVIFDGVDSWEAWGLVPSSRPSVNMPSIRTNTIEIPGMNGVLDLSEVPLGYPTYGLRTGSWEFNVAHDAVNKSWDVLYSDIACALHGRQVQCILKDERSFYYEGRLEVGDWNTDKVFSKITIKYSMQPFKRMIWSTTEDWLWNPFDFVNGIITQRDFRNIRVESSAWTTLSYTQDFVGMAPVSPTLYVKPDQPGGTMTMRVQNTGVSNKIHEFVLSGSPDSSGVFVVVNPLIEFVCPTKTSRTNIALMGAGTISIDFRPGRL